MDNHHRHFFSLTVGFLVIISYLLSACTPAQVVLPTATGEVVPTQANIPPTLPPTQTPTLAPTLPPLPALTLEKGNNYFTIDGKQSILFSRNPTGKTQEDFDVVLDWAHQGGTRFIRVHIITGWWGDPWINKDGSFNEAWARHWDHFFDQAQADGIYVMPVFGVWADWNNGKPNIGGELWQYNPLNQANGGPLNAPGELFQADSPAQKIWLAWLKTLVERWQGRANIAAWEIFSEINIASGAPAKTSVKGDLDKAVGVEFANKAAAIVRAADTRHRPVTLSLAVATPLTDQWADFYRLDTLDFIQVHPYTATLDRELVMDVQANLAQYHKPVMIGESGLFGNYAIAQNAWIGINHAIWAGVVSGAMNGRGLWSNDGYAFYDGERALALQYMQVYAKAELPAVNFSREVDFKGFKPLAVSFPPGTKIWGAAVGNEGSAIGWFRDTKSEPPDWNLLPVISGQSVTITVPGSTSDWKVDFYDTKTGTDIVASTTATRQGNGITVNLPDFKDDIAFKMTARVGLASTPAPALTTGAIAGKWSGTITNTARTFSTPLNLEIQPGCEPGRVCGTFSAPRLPCSGKLFLQGITGMVFTFIEQNASGAASCTSGGSEYLQLMADGTLSYKFSFTPGGAETSKGILKRP